MPGSALLSKGLFFGVFFLNYYHSVAKIPDSNLGSVYLIKSLSKSVSVLS